MPMTCANCGKILKDSAKFCGNCGTKVEHSVQNEVTEPKCAVCGNVLAGDSVFCPQCGTQVERVSPNRMTELKCHVCGNTLKNDSVFCDKCGTRVGGQNTAAFNTHTNLPNIKHISNLKGYANQVKGKGDGIISNIKALPNNKRRVVYISLCGLAVLIILAIFGLLFLNCGVSDEVVSQAALQIAEQDYGYKLELTSYDIIDSFNASSKTITGNEFKAKMYLVILEADAKDQSGAVADTVKYAVSVVDPEVSDGFVTYSQFSQAQNCTGMENSEIEELLRSNTASFR